MPYVADLHIHSKYSRATAKDMDVASLSGWARAKGVSMLGTGDFTHPSWMAELRDRLEPVGRGVYRHGGIDFLLTAEVSNIYLKAGRTRKVHTIVCAPDIDIADEIGSALAEYGNLASDGRPILHLSCEAMARLLFGIDPDILIIPAHAWTPHFSIFGSNAGFDSPEECFEGELDRIYALETGLSSDPAMNWRWSNLDRFSLLSFSDAHSPSKIGREATIFRGPIDYPALVDILRTKDRERLRGTVEFFPEEGKYHWDGHRQCGARLSPREAIAAGDRCPVCGKKVTVGVAHRLEMLADRDEGYVDRARPPFRHAVPLAEIIAGALGVSAGTKTVAREYERLIRLFGTEFALLFDAPPENLRKKCPAQIARGIMNVRMGTLDIQPGYDGEYGTVNIFRDEGGPREKQLRFL